MYDLWLRLGIKGLKQKEQGKKKPNTEESRVKRKFSAGTKLKSLAAQEKKLLTINYLGMVTEKSSSLSEEQVDFLEKYTGK